MKRVTLYTKPGCHLCNPVRKTILDARLVRPFEFEERNILDDPADFERFREAIPVVTVDGAEIARYRLATSVLMAALGADAGC